VGDRADSFPAFWAIDRNINVIGATQNGTCYPAAVALPERVGSLASELNEIFSNNYSGSVRLALLFGSRARGSVRDSSDIDLAIDAPNVDLDGLRVFLAERFGVDVDISFLADATIPLLDALIQDGIVVYETQPGIGARWRSRTLADLETDRPWYGRMRDAWLRRVAERGLPHGQ
jgi:predicted nucleotidyltransferase